MLRSIKELYGDNLIGLDGEIGQVLDFYFDDQTWVIRYVVAGTGAWLPGRQVLISPHSLVRLGPARKYLQVKLRRDEVERGPAVKARQSISRQYEEEYHRYYGWPYYWQGGGLWGASNYPNATPARKEFTQGSQRHGGSGNHA